MLVAGVFAYEIRRFWKKCSQLHVPCMFLQVAAAFTSNSCFLITIISQGGVFCLLLCPSGHKTSKQVTTLRGVGVTMHLQYTIQWKCVLCVDVCCMWCVEVKCLYESSHTKQYVHDVKRWRGTIWQCYTHSLCLTSVRVWIMCVPCTYTCIRCSKM